MVDRHRVVGGSAEGAKHAEASVGVERRGKRDLAKQIRSDVVRAGEREQVRSGGCRAQREEQEVFVGARGARRVSAWVSIRRDAASSAWRGFARRSPGRPWLGP